MRAGLLESCIERSALLAAVRELERLGEAISMGDL